MVFSCVRASFLSLNKPSVLIFNIKLMLRNDDFLDLFSLYGLKLFSHVANLVSTLPSFFEISLQLPPIGFFMCLVRALYRKIYVYLRIFINCFVDICKVLSCKFSTRTQVLGVCQFSYYRKYSLTHPLRFTRPTFLA